MTLEIPVMHYTGMAAVSFVPTASTGSLIHAVEISSLGTVVISSATMIILGLRGGGVPSFAIRENYGSAPADTQGGKR